MSDLDHPPEAASLACVTPPRARPIYRILAAVAALFFLGAGVFGLCEQLFVGKPSLIAAIVLSVAFAALLIQVAVTGRAGLIQDARKSALAFLVLICAALSADALIDGHLAQAVFLLFATCYFGYLVVSARRQKHTANSA